MLLPMRSWGEFAAAEPALASFGADRLAHLPAYLATVREDGMPRVHPVTPVVTAEGLFVFMESTSPKGRDLRERGGFALHSGVPDSEGTGGEFFVGGTGLLVRGRLRSSDRRTGRELRPRRSIRPVRAPRE